MTCDPTANTKGDIAKGLAAAEESYRVRRELLNAERWNRLTRPQASSSASFPQPTQLFTIEDLGGWDKVSSRLFGAQGLWTRVVEDLAKK